MTRWQGAIFDVDGVLVDSPHERAWREALRDLMEHEWASIRPATTWTPDAFTPLVYQEHVSGRPRLAGARGALAAFHVPDLDTRALEYADRKQAVLLRFIDAGEFHAYPDALRFLLAVKDLGLRTAAASSSKNASRMLASVRLDTFAAEHGITSPSVRPGLTLLDAFDVDVSGRDFPHGKPHPDMFLAAAAELGVEPAEAIVMEDAAAGVQAAKAGGMAAIGIARFDDSTLLTAAGADLVVTSLDHVDVDRLARGELVSTRPPAGTE